jgi:uncharacterized RDD family membrane protein YckC
LQSTDTDTIALGVLLSILLLGLLAIVQIILLANRGQTFGKKMMKIRVVRFADGGNPGFLSAVVLRLFVPGLISAVPCAGSLFSLADVLFIFGTERRCIHDHIAGTKVVRWGSS